MQTRLFQTAAYGQTKRKQYSKEKKANKKNKTNRRKQRTATRSNTQETEGGSLLILTRSLHPLLFFATHPKQTKSIFSFAKKNTGTHTQHTHVPLPPLCGYSLQQHSLLSFLMPPVAAIGYTPPPSPSFLVFFSLSSVAKGNKPLPLSTPAPVPAPVPQPFWPASERERERERESHAGMPLLTLTCTRAPSLSKKQQKKTKL